MPRGKCHCNKGERACSCAMGNLSRFIEPVALLILKKRGTSYGYELLGYVCEYAFTNAVIEPAALYRTLRVLEENGHVVSVWDVEGSGPARRSYRLTIKGEEHLLEWSELLSQMSTAMSRFVTEVNEYSKPIQLKRDALKASTN